MKNPWARAVLMSAVLVLGASAASAETNFPATVQLGGQTLVKNGQGTRYRAVFKVYDMALYLPSRTQDAAQVLAMPGAKRASFVALRDIPADQFKALKEKLGDQVRIGPYLATYFLIINSAKPPFDDERVRRALSLQVDREFIADRIWGGTMLASSGLRRSPLASRTSPRSVSTASTSPPSIRGIHSMRPG